MKAVVTSVFVVAVLLLPGISRRSVAKDPPIAPMREPNSGYVTDAAAAKEIAMVVLGRLLPPSELAHKQFFDADLKDGLWTVQCREPATRISFPIIVQIRQKSGAIVKYENPNA